MTLFLFAFSGSVFSSCAWRLISDSGIIGRFSHRRIIGGGFFSWRFVSITRAYCAHKTSRKRRVFGQFRLNSVAD
jgi:hypothetical protein